MGTSPCSCLKALVALLLGEIFKMKKMKGDTISLPFSHSQEGSSQREKEENVRQRQAAVFAEFNAKRNAGRIERYFIKTRSNVAIISIFVVSSIIFIVLDLLGVLLNKESYDYFFKDSLYILMRSSTRYQIAATKNLLFDNSYYADMFAFLLESPRILSMDITEGIDILQMFCNAMSASFNDYGFSYDLGLEDGAFYSIQGNHGHNNYFLYYANTSKKGGYSHPISTWISDEYGYNASYPFVGGVYEDDGTYDAAERGWYKATKYYNHSLFSKAYVGIGVGNMIDLPLMSVTSPISNASHFLGVIGVTMKFGEIQNLIKSNMPSPNSRFAIVREDNTVVGVSGSDTAVDIYRSNIILKDINALRDPVWAVIRKDSRFINGVNYSSEYVIDGVKRTYSITHQFWEAFPNAIWTFHSLICATDFYKSESISISYFLITLLIGLIIIILMVLIIRINNHIIEAEQFKTLGKNEEYLDRHIEPLGIKTGFRIIKTFNKTHNDNPEIVEQIDKILLSIRTTPKVSYFEPRVLYSNIKNVNILKKFISLYGGIDVQIDRQAIDISENSFNNKFYKSYGSVSMSSAIALVDHTNSLFTIRSSLFDVMVETISNDVQNIIFKYLEESPFFEESTLREILKSLVEKINPNLQPLLLDSFTFLHILLQYRVYSLLPKPDYCIALFISIISWHISMNDRSNPELDLVDRYFINDHKRYEQTTKEILKSLYQIRIDDNNDRWNEFVYSVIEIIRASSLKKQQLVFSDFYLFSHTITMSGTLLEPEALTVMKLLLSGATFSFFFHSPESCRKSREYMNGDFETNETAINQFINCAFNVHITVLTKSLGELVSNSKFMRLFYEK